VLLDMDGTLIDLHFDSHLWQTLVPARYAERLGLPLAEAKAQIDTHYHAVNGTLDWYCVDYWTGRSGSTSAPSSEILEDPVAPQRHSLPGPHSGPPASRWCSSPMPIPPACR
jgi:hypothetical protein